MTLSAHGLLNSALLQKLLVIVIDRYWTDPTARRNMVDTIRFEKPVGSFRRRLPVECFAWPRIQGLRGCVECLTAMLVQIGGFRKALAMHTVGIFVAAALPSVAQQAIVLESAERGI
ncbi:MAG: hypothetical protein H7245_17145 [Candidatus Saccharibacteria bacterium]|nr:hypothetical protein [Pseudorhodobacter sp.]